MTSTSGSSTPKKLLCRSCNKPVLRYGVEIATRGPPDAARAGSTARYDLFIRVSAGAVIGSPECNLIEDRREYRPPANRAERVDMRGDRHPGPEPDFLLRH